MSEYNSGLTPPNHKIICPAKLLGAYLLWSLDSKRYVDYIKMI